MDAINAGRFAEGGVVDPALGNPIPYVPSGGITDFVSKASAQAVGEYSALSAKVAGGSGFGPTFGLRSDLMMLPSDIPGLPAAGGAISDFTLSLLTHAGQFDLNASADTIEAIRSSSIGSKLTSTGTKPSWY